MVFTRVLAVFVACGVPVFFFSPFGKSLVVFLGCFRASTGCLVPTVSVSHRSPRRKPAKREDRWEASANRWLEMLTSRDDGHNADSPHEEPLAPCRRKSRCSSKPYASKTFVFSLNNPYLKT